MAHVVKIGFSDRMPAFEWDEEPEPMASFGFSFGRRIDDLSIFPKSATQKDTKKICDVFSMPALNCVNGRFRDLVEEFEPGVHQFIPISLKRKDGTPIEGEYFIFNCCQLLGAVLVNETKCGEWRKVVAGPDEDVIVVNDGGGGTDLLTGIEKIIGTAQTDAVILEVFIQEQLENLLIEGGGGSDVFLAKGYTAAELEIDFADNGNQLIREKNAGGPILQLRNFISLFGSDLSDKITSGNFKNIVKANDPLVLDLDGGGFDLSGISLTGPRFDIDGDGFYERTGWIGAGEGFLARDTNADGEINNISELFGTSTTSGFTALSELDDVANGGNADGMIDANDAGFADLLVWVDANSDGITDDGELKTLAELDIESFSLTTQAPVPGEENINGIVVIVDSEHPRIDDAFWQPGCVALHPISAYSCAGIDPLTVLIKFNGYMEGLSRYRVVPITKTKHSGFSVGVVTGKPKFLDLLPNLACRYSIGEFQPNCIVERTGSISVAHRKSRYAKVARRGCDFCYDKPQRWRNEQYHDCYQ